MNNTLENLLENLKEEENNVLTRKAQLADDEKRVKDIQLLIFCEESGLKVGDIVDYYSKQYVFCGLNWWNDINSKNCWIDGNLIKKNGNVSTHKTNLYSQWGKV